MSIYTKQETLSQDLDIWAVPTREDGFPFKYELRRQFDAPYERGSVMVNTVTLKYVVPGGINLLAKAIQTLEESKARAFQEYHTRAKEIDAQIEQLRLLAPPEPEPYSIEGEYSESDNTPDA